MSHDILPRQHGGSIEPGHNELGLSSLLMQVPGCPKIRYDISGQPPDELPIEQVHVSGVIPKLLLRLLRPLKEGLRGGHGNHFILSAADH